MSEVIGYTIVTHYADKSTQTTKMSAAQAAALASVVGKPASKYTYINSDECPIHGPWRAVPGGTTASGRDYPAFWSCDVAKGEERCRNKPSTEWVETHPPERVIPTTTAEDFDSLPF